MSAESRHDDFAAVVAEALRRSGGGLAALEERAAELERAADGLTAVARQFPTPRNVGKSCAQVVCQRIVNSSCGIVIVYSVRGVVVFSDFRLIL